LLFVAVSLSYIFKSSFFGKILVIIFMVFFLSHNYSDIKTYLSKNPSESNAIMLANQKEAIDWIYKDAGSEQFNVDVYVPPVIPYSYQYLFTWLSTSKYHQLPNENNVPLLYIVREADPEHPDRVEAWQDRQAGIAKIEKTILFGGIAVEKRERFNAK